MLRRPVLAAPASSQRSRLCRAGSFVKLGNWAAGKLARWNHELHTSERRESLVDRGSESQPRVGRAARNQIGEHCARLGFHGATIERGADLEAALDLFVDIADGEGRHVSRIA